MSTASITRETSRAQPGDRLVIRRRRLGGREPDGEILEVLGEDGSPPYVVRWSDDGHVSTLFPGPDAFIEHFERLGRRPPRRQAKRASGKRR